MPNVSPFLWFDTQAEQAATFYVSVFKNSKVTRTSRYGEAGPRPKGTVMNVEFELDGKPFTAVNGGPEFRFNEAISFVVNCTNQTEVDDYWAKLSDGGEEGPCGWLKDKFGLSWQVIPTNLSAMLGDPDQKRSGNVMRAFQRMKKIDIAALQQAYAL